MPKTPEDWRDLEISIQHARKTLRRLDQDVEAARDSVFVDGKDWIRLSAAYGILDQHVRFLEKKLAKKPR
jgi:hypothetical protein